MNGKINPPVDSWKDWLAKLPMLSVTFSVIVELPVDDDDANVMVPKLAETLAIAILDDETVGK